MIREKKSFFGLAKRSFGFWFGGIWLFTGAPFLIIGIYDGVQTWKQEAQLKREGQVTSGTVVTKEIRKGKGSIHYRVGYRFKTPEGNVVKGEEEINSRLWDRLEERGPIQVIFVPGRPDIHRIEGEGADWMLPIILTILGLVFAPLGGFIFSKALARIWLELCLREKGMIAEGTVLEVGPTNFMLNDIPRWRISYSYHDQQGKAHQAKTGLVPPEEAEIWQVGDKGTVRYDLRSPRKSIWLGKDQR